MWQRRSFHECVAELEQISERFRRAHIGEGISSDAERQQKLVETSKAGVEILRVLALAIRSEQDTGLIPKRPDRVGYLTTSLSEDDCRRFIETYTPLAVELDGFKPLSLRDALNKIAHADPYGSGYFADLENHDLILSGTQGRQRWLAVISIPTLCRVIKALPNGPVSPASKRGANA